MYHRGDTSLIPEKKSEPKVIVAGGGTGGHLFPGLAVAGEIRRRYPEAEILFVTGRRKMESEILERSGFRRVSIQVEGLKGRGWKRGAVVVLKLPFSLFQSLMIVRRFSPDLIFGVGGYSSGPVCLAGRMMGVPTAIHEQNSIPGLTNRLLCRVVNRVFISFQECGVLFPGGNLILTGNPIRRELVKARVPKGGERQGFTVLVMGGSQGARAVNRAFVEALEILKERGKGLQVIHQTGELDFDRVAEAYRSRGLQGEVLPFIEDMVEAYGKADLVVSRAGATTVSELAALGLPSILIPYPHAANNHQEINARMLADGGGAEMVRERDLSGKGLADLLLKCMTDTKGLKDMGLRAGAAGRADATGIIVDRLVEMIEAVSPP